MYKKKGNHAFWHFFFYLFSSTCLINSVKFGHSCKILYLTLSPCDTSDNVVIFTGYLVLSQGIKGKDPMPAMSLNLMSLLKR